MSKAYCGKCARSVTPREALELALERAERPEFQCLTMSATLVEIYRIAPRGFTASEAAYWTDRLNKQCDAIQSQNESERAS